MFTVDLLFADVRKLKETHDAVVREKDAVSTEVLILKDENRELGEEVIQYVALCWSPMCC